MAIFGTLRNEFFRHRKSKGTSIDGSVPGVPYNRFRRTTTSPSGSGHRAGQAGHHHDLYMHGMPEEYRPNINAPSVDWDDYETYEPIDIQHASHRSTERFPHSSDIGNAQQDFDLMPKDDLTLTEQLIHAMGMRDEVEGIPFDQQPRVNIRGQDINMPVKANEDLDIDELILHQAEATIDDENLDHYPDIGEIADALSQLSKVFPPEHEDLVNLRSAMRELLGFPELCPEIKDSADDSGLSQFGTGALFEHDPFEEARQIFEQQMQVLMPGEADTNPDFTGEQHLEEFVEHELQDNLLPEDAMPGMIENESIDGTVMMPENEGMALNEINQAIDQLKEDSMLQNPFQQLYDPLIAQQYMVDPQYMPDYMIPGPMPFGPMGPMPM